MSEIRSTTMTTSGNPVQTAFGRFLHWSICVSMLTGAVVYGGVQPYDLDNPEQPWKTSKSGITSRVMPPYTPLVRDGLTVSCWGREYVLDGLFLSAVKSQQHKFLKQPVELRVKNAGEWKTVAGSETEFTLERPDRIEFKSTGRVDALSVAADSWVEYDGLIRTDLTLSGSKPTTIDGLQLVFVFEPAASILHHLEKRWSTSVYANTPGEVGAVVDYGWNPLVLVGNHDVAFTIVTETWNGWTSAEKGAISLKRNDNDLTVTFNLITEPTDIDGDLTYEFGFMASPAKPMRADRFAINIGAMPTCNVTTTMHGKNVHKYFSYPQPSGDFDEIDQMISRNLKSGRRHLYYITTSSTGAESEVYKRNYEDWVAAKAILTGTEWTFGKPTLGAGSACPASTFADFMSWAVENIMKTFPDNYGIYIDNPGPYWCENATHGCGGGDKKTYPYFSLRDLHKRIYTVVKSYKPDGLVWEHTSETFNPLQLAWIDIYSDGEHWRDKKRFPKEDVYRLFNRAYMDISGSGQQVGAVPCFLSSMGTWRGDWAHWLLSRTLPFGQMMTIYHGWIDGTPGIVVARARSEFGLGVEEVDFYLPHQLPRWFPVSGEDVVACLWQRRTDKALLAVLANWGDEPVTAKMNDQAVSQHLGPIVAADALTGVTFPGPVMVSIPANSFRLVRIEPKKE